MTPKKWGEGTAVGGGHPRGRRLRCPEHGVLAESVPFARPGSGFTRDFEELVVWLATKCDKKTVSVFCRVAWRTVGTMCARIVAERLDDDHLSNLVDIGVDEISWRKHHKYLTLVSDHETGKIVWGAPGKKAATLDRFFTDALPEGGPHKIEAVSMDLGPAFAKSVRTHAPQAVLCFDPFHVVKLATDALDDVRRQVWQSARTLSDKQIARTYKGARWALLKNPEKLTDTQKATLARLKREGGALVRAYELKESLRAVFAGDLDTDTVTDMLGKWCSWAQRCRIHLRTTNPIESTFATVRLRTKVTKGPGSRAAGLAMAYKLIDAAQARWRSVNAPHLVALVRAGAVFHKGKLLERPTAITPPTPPPDGDQQAGTEVAWKHPDPQVLTIPRMRTDSQPVETAGHHPLKPTRGNEN